MALLRKSAILFQFSNMSRRKTKQPRGHPLIFRRRNQQILRNHLCPATPCPKAYGSYAALYMHVKLKHPDFKLQASHKPEPLKHSGRPRIKKKQQQINNSDWEDLQVLCQLCRNLNCDCLETQSNLNPENTIAFMRDEGFRQLVRYMGVLRYEGFEWVRQTDEDYSFRSFLDISRSVDSFNRKYGRSCHFKKYFIRCLSYALNFCRTEHIDEFLEAIYLIMSHSNTKTSARLIQQNGDTFPHMKACIQEESGAFKDFQLFVRSFG